MGRGKRNATLVISSSDDEDFLVKLSSKPASVPRTNYKKRPKKAALSNSCPRSRTQSKISDFDEARLFLTAFVCFTVFWSFLVMPLAFYLIFLVSVKLNYTECSIITSLIDFILLYFRQEGIVEYCYLVNDLEFYTIT